MYGNKEAQIEYLPFLKDTFVLKYVINEPYTGKHSTYEEKNTAYNILDLFAKNFFSVFLVIILMNLKKNS